MRYWESDRDISEANDTVIYIGNKLEATIDDLTPGKTYYLRVLAFSQGGEGKMSSPAWQFQVRWHTYLSTYQGSAKRIFPGCMCPDEYL